MNADAADTRPRVAAQQPTWPDPDHARRTIDRLRAQPPLVTPAECDDLRGRLAEVAAGRAFLVQGGDCAERFGTPVADLERKLGTLLDVSTVLTYAMSLPVVQVGRVAGQYAKPRSQPVEVRDGVSLPVYRGDAVNGPEFTARARRPDPTRMDRMYDEAARALRVLRSTAQAGWADPAAVRDRLREFVTSSPAAARYGSASDELDRALGFLAAWGAGRPGWAELFASHEALLLDYEQALTRSDPATGDSYGSSGHLLWIGDRTRHVDGAHVEFAAGVRNPVAVKVGPSTTPDEVMGLIDRLDPHREPGRLTLVTRMGAGQVLRRLPPIVDRVIQEGGRVGWVCDPMHGNTFEAASGRKTRRFDDIVDELREFVAVHRGLGTNPGGVQLEFTGDEVTECIGGGREVFVTDLHHRYETVCDPRLSRGQALDLAFLLAETYWDG